MSNTRATDQQQTFNSLCEILPTSLLESSAAMLTFNSLCEIPSDKVSESDSDLLPAFNSLCEIRCFRLAAQESTPKLSILYVRFTTPGKPGAKNGIRTFNSLCEIQPP